ncbi:MAG: hypothetical protein RLZ98_1120 [Pseudomonadota bacterium]|jgi:ATP-dependent RNA helicase SUPV3L1/SUV3
MSLEVEHRSRNVTAVLGPTNTGKTHLAIERMLGHESGMIGLPLRLLAREVYDRIVSRVGAANVALITGEEKIKPEEARYWVSTVEAMPREVSVDFLAIDEVQLCADPERGHVFTDRLLHARGKLETLLLGAGTIREAIADLVPGANFITRPRLSKLIYSGQKKTTRLPARTAVVAFSAAEVYAIAELMRRQRGGAAVVMGALSPRTRNAQVALYQSGDVDYMIATDAIGMGLNLDVDHVAFASARKFDGQNFRQLTPVEIGQIAGRAGRHMNDGTFGVTGDVEPFDPELIDRLENHVFEPVKVLQWRARKLDFSNLEGLRESLRQLPSNPRLVRARMADDVIALETVAVDRDIAERARGHAEVERLWEVCQVPDYRKISPQNHAELVAQLYRFLTQADGVIPEDWFARQVNFANRTDGDIDTLANRISHIRTWTFVSNRAEWLQDPAYWQERTREIEDKLSDALHECLTQRFVDRRTSALMKGLRANDELNADITDEGAIMVESHFVGRIKGFRFYPDQADGVDGKAARNAAARVLTKELAMRARRVAAAKNDAFKLTTDARLLWRGEEIARLEPGEDVLKPQIVLISDDNLQPADQGRVTERLNSWLTTNISERLKPLVDIAVADDIQGLARGIAFRMCEDLGALKRDLVANEVKSLDQNARAQLRKYGVRFGAFNVYCPVLLKPAAAELTLTLWTLKHAKAHGLDPAALPETPRAGLTSAPTDVAIPEDFYRAYGFHVCGPRAIRIDILERLADIIRPLLSWRGNVGEASAAPPKGSTGDGGFIVTPDMMSILGCSADELGKVLLSLGFRCERRKMEIASAEASRPVPTGEPCPGELSLATETTVAGVPGGEVVKNDELAESLAPASSQSVETATVLETEPSAPESAEQQPSAEMSATQENKEAATEVLEQFVEIWRPKRKNRPQQGQHRGRRQNNQPSARSNISEAVDASSEASTGVGARERNGGSDRKGQRNRSRPGGERNQSRDFKQGGRQQQDRRRDDDKRPSQRHSSKSGQASKAIDPDSPFAALGALKEALQKRAQDPSSSS